MAREIKRVEFARVGPLTFCLEFEIVKYRRLWNGMREITEADIRCIRIQEDPPLTESGELVDPRDGDGWVEAVAREGVRIGFDPFAWEAYYETTHWEWITAHWKIGWCADCKQHVPTQLHHVDYSRLGAERPEDVIELCDRCHRRRHGLDDALPFAA